MRHFPVYFFLSLLLLVSVIGAAGCSRHGIGKNDATTGDTPDHGGLTTPSSLCRILLHRRTHSVQRDSTSFREATMRTTSPRTHLSRSKTVVTWRSSPLPIRPWLPRCTILYPPVTFDTAMTGTDAMQKRFMRHLAEGTGLEDFAISSPGLNLSEEQMLAERGGVILAGPIPMSRTRPDGICVRWNVAVPVFNYSTCVPFLIVDDTPRTLRVPDGNVTAHPNGATGIRSIEIATYDPVAVTRWYDTVLSTSPMGNTPTTYTLNGSVIMVRGVARNETEGPVGILLNTDTGAPFSLQNFTFE